MQQDNHQSQNAKRVLFIMALGLMAVISCAQFNQAPVSSSNATAISATIQAFNVASTPGGAPLADIGESYARTIEFSGRKWKVKASNQPVGPGPNYFSDSTESVWVDENGQLHLKVIHKDGKWHSAEVITTEPLGYGTYQFKVASRAGQLDKFAVLGLFTWDTAAPEYNYREIDIELSQWGEEGSLNAQFVIQPWKHPGNRQQFTLDPQADFSSHSFIWTPQNVQFISSAGGALAPDTQKIVKQWSYTGADIPPAGPGNARINLWLMGGMSPSNGQEIEMILPAFEYIPQATQ